MSVMMMRMINMMKMSKVMNVMRMMKMVKGMQWMNMMKVKEGWLKEESSESIYKPGCDCLVRITEVNSIHLHSDRCKQWP